MPDDLQETRIGATASPEKWLAHAQQKLRKGYELVIPVGKKAAYLQKRGRDEEPCPYKTARRILASGVLSVIREDEDDIVYRLTADLPPPPPVVEDDDDEDDGDDFVTEEALAAEEGDLDDLGDLDDDSDSDAPDFDDDNDYALSGEADDDDD